MDYDTVLSVSYFVFLSRWVSDVDLNFGVRMSTAILGFRVLASILGFGDFPCFKHGNSKTFNMTPCFVRHRNHALMKVKMR